jgi:glycosyltransferase involved in cell wall biosynthesis
MIIANERSSVSSSMASRRDGPVRVLFLSSYTGLGGGETSLLSLFGALDRSRVEPLLACPREGQLTEAARRLDVQVRIVEWRGASVWFVPSLWTHAPATARILTCIDELRPAVVHSEFHALPYAMGAARRRALPVIFICYGWWFRPKPWQRALYRGSSIRVLAISEAVRAGFLGTPPFMDAARVPVVHLGVDTRIYRPRPAERQSIRSRLGLPASAPLVTLVARFQNVKGHHIFLDMANRVLLSEPRARFAIAGENVFGGRGDEAYKRRIRDTVDADPALQAAVQFLGWISETEDLLAASDVVVCSSLFESFGMVHLEAMACEVPVVSTDVGGPAETIVDGATGFLVPPGRPDLLAARVLRLLGDPHERQALGRAGRVRVIERFSVDRYAETMLNVFDAVTGDARTARAPSA